MKVLITRPKQKAKYFSDLLEKNGFEPLILPTLELSFKNVEVSLDGYDWIVFTSPRGIEGLFRNLTDSQKMQIKDKKIGVIGTETAKEFKKIFNFEPDLVPNSYTAENLLEALKKVVKPDEKILIPTTPATRDVLVKNLNADLLFVYTSGEPEDIAEKLNGLKELLKDTGSENLMLTFTSGLTAKNFFKHADDELMDLFKKCTIVSIGPITKENVDKFGFDSIMPEKTYTIDGMMDLILNLKK
ncbi:uroporphyrinogen-III synthase [Methanococcus voltae]|uniref:Uroporphyrinogen-III synthase n=2 Tax=Methanococcus voltae TaxID=2188 RepID=A0A8J7RFZ4_METVO|nr:uroporphyrinogen-III synthase [Methanococcus voltae]MBP2172931.1 uroporphyrinogen-III synthase [Methanococcus voltae]MBP2201659.1 uroporphyrinogen-III synthase [Methanococcus voltae]MCS3922447.1 uroporphyrinogen-III synthase [Methanococcus voltae PS]